MVTVSLTASIVGVRADLLREGKKKEQKKKTINRKHINIFLTALVGRLSHPSQGQTGQNSDFLLWNY